MKTTLLTAAILAATMTAQASAADLWRMYKCTGDHGETVYSDRSGYGTACREMWIESTPADGSGWTVTEGRVKTAEKEIDQ